MRMRLVVLGAVALAMGACSSSSTSNGTASDAGASDAGEVRTEYDWSCLGKVTLPPPAASTLSVNLTIEDYRSLGLANADVRACPDPTDATCAAGTTAKKTDANGKVTIDVPAGTAGFAGYFEAVDPTDVTSLHFVPDPFVKTPINHGRGTYRAADLKILTDSIGVTIDATRGHILVQVQDCLSKALPQNDLAMSPVAGGVTLTLDPMPAGVVLAYVTKSVVSKTATETYDGSGAAGFINVPPGIYTVTGKRAKTGERVGSLKVHARAGAHSMLILAPTP
jgi:hypothetical protein